VPVREPGSPSAARLKPAAIGNEGVAFIKHCVNYKLITRGRDMLATMVTVPETTGTFIELGTRAALISLPPWQTSARPSAGAAG
jgi:hypothetical protein